MASGTPDDEESSLREHIKGIFDDGFRMGFILGRIDGATKFLIFLGGQKFGPPNDAVKAGIGCLADCDDLQDLSARIPDASSWEELLYSAPPYEPEKGPLHWRSDTSDPAADPADPAR
jgi:hypothetical protein